MWYGFNVLWFFSAGGPNPEISPEKIKIDENDLCYKLFTEHGFTWGGNWNSE